MSDQHNQAKSIFLTAIEDHPREQWPSFLDEACGNDAALRAEVEKLLHAHAQLGSFHEVEPGDALATLEQSPLSECAGTVIGPYKLLEQIGEGGFGVVFMAEQTEPVRRKVALKLLKAGMDTKQVIARFEAERQALALMDHPNIARVFDGGTTESSRQTPSAAAEGSRQTPSAAAEGSRQTPSAAAEPAADGTRSVPATFGRPYFVMELVKGIAMTDYCDQCQLTMRERLELFLSVCQAVQHAHMKGIIHRDIKPSNVLVAIQDGKPVVKVIDFGVAKAINQRLSEHTLQTGFHQMIGTPLYMSPEQAEMSPLDVDTRADIYSLGVLLYQLLTGTTPFEKERLSKATFDEIRRIIREEEPPRPSVRLSTLQDKATDVATQRRTDPRHLKRSVQGELDWIVMKALEKDRNRRYETASAFAADVQRYLDDEPVEACPPSVGYRLRKFVRRKKAALGVAGLVLIFLILLGAGSSWVIRDRSARQEGARQQAGESLKRAHAWLKADKLALARKELAEAKGRLGNDRAALPELAEGIDALERKLARLQHFFDLIEQAHDTGIGLTLEPTLPAKSDRGTQSSSATVRLILRDRAKTVPLLLQALACYHVLERDDWLAALKDSLGAEAQVRRVRHSLYEELLRLADDVLKSRRDHRSGGKLSPAEAARRGSVYLHKAEQARRPTLAFYRQRARCHRALGEEEAAAADDKLVRNTPPTLAVDYYLLGLTALRARDKAEAVKQFEAALRLEPTHYLSLMDIGLCLAILGDQSRDLEEAVTAFTGCIMKRPKHVLAWNIRGDVYIMLHQYAKAIDDFSKIIKLKPDYAWAWYNRGVAHQELGHFQQAIADYSKAIKLKPDDWRPWCNRGSVYGELRRYDKAIADFSEAIKRKPNLAVLWYNRAFAYAELRKYDKAIFDYTKVIERKPKFVSAWNNRARAYSALRQVNKAIADFTEAIKLEPKNAVLWSNRGALYQGLRQYAKALADHTQAIKLKTNDAMSWYNRGSAYAEMRQYAKAIADFTEAIKLEPKRVSAWYNRGIMYQKLGDLDKAVRDLSKAIKLKPDDVEAWANRAVDRFRLRQYEEALADFSKVIELKPKRVSAWNNRGLAYEILGQHDKAHKDFAKYVKLLTKAIEDRPNDSSVWSSRGFGYWKLQRWQEAIADFTHALKLKNVNERSIRANRGFCLCEQGHWRKAAADFARALELNPASAKTHYLHALAQLGAGDLDGYRKSCATLLKQFPKFKSLQDAQWVMWTFVLAPDALTDFSPVLAQMAAKTKPGAASFAEKRGALLYRAGRWQEAVTTLTKVDQLAKSTTGGIKISPAYAWYFLAMAHHRAGNAKEARRWLDKAVAWTKRILKEDGKGGQRLPWNRRLTLRLLRREAEELLKIKRRP